MLLCKTTTVQHYNGHFERSQISGGHGEVACVVEPHFFLKHQLIRGRTNMATCRVGKVGAGAAENHSLCHVHHEHINITLPALLPSYNMTPTHDEDAITNRAKGFFLHTLALLQYGYLLWTTFLGLINWICFYGAYLHPTSTPHPVYITVFGAFVLMIVVPMVASWFLVYRLGGSNSKSSLVVHVVVVSLYALILFVIPLIPHSNRIIAYYLWREEHMMTVIVSIGVFVFISCLSVTFVCILYQLAYSRSVRFFYLYILYGHPWLKFSMKGNDHAQDGNCDEVWSDEDQKMLDAFKSTLEVI